MDDQEPEVFEPEQTTDIDLDTIAVVTPEDIEEAIADWEKRSPDPKFKEILGAEFRD